jgi:NAD(P)-dependent dehydrogenase (short-subunit alcohol dehydrogenase family)
VVSDPHRGRVAIVTGAGGGIGSAVARRLAGEGVAVACADLDGRRAAATADAIAAVGDRALACATDITSRRSVDDLVAAVEDQLGPIGILVNNAGVIEYAPVLELTETAWDRVLGVNLKGPFFCAQAAAASMVRRGTGGVIVNVTSISAELPEPDCLHYGVAKAGLAHMTRTLALDLARHGIRVIAVAPGTIRTPMNAELLRDPAVVDSRLRNIPLGRLGEPADVADAVAFVVSDAARYVTGSTLWVEGGMMLVR